MKNLRIRTILESCVLNLKSFSVVAILMFLFGANYAFAVGGMVGSSAFYNLEILNNSGTDATTSPSVVFQNAASTTGTFTAILPNTKIQFYAGASSTATTTLQNIVISGQAAGTKVSLRAATTTANWTWGLEVPGTRSVAYADVMDSNACSGYSNITASNSTDSGGNTCWDFGGGTAGTLTISNNDGGVELSKFDDSLDPTDQTVTNAELFSFKLTPTGETVTASPIVVRLSYIQSVNCGDFTTLELYYDTGGDGSTSGDSAVGSVACSISGNSGTMSITGAFAASTAKNFILRTGTFSNNNPGNSIRFSLSPSDITATGPIAGSITPTGSVTEVNQFRSNIVGGQGGGGGTPTQTSTVEVPTSGGGPGGGQGSDPQPTPTETPTGGGGPGGGDGTWILFNRFFASAISGFEKLFSSVWQ